MLRRRGSKPIVHSPNCHHRPHCPQNTTSSKSKVRVHLDSYTVVVDGFAIDWTEVPLSSDMPSDEQETVVTPTKQPEATMGTQKAILCLIGIFVMSISALTFVYMKFPELEPEEYQHIKLPREIQDAKDLGAVLSRYKERYYTEVMLGVFVTYIFLQTFAIPGSIFLSILSGFLFDWRIALLVICFCSATGASFCYLLSFIAGRPLVLKFFPQRAKEWQEKVDRHRDNLLFYIIFLRITPFLPNWFINITAPVINVELMPFWLGTFVGVAPPSLLAVQAGTTLYQLTSSTDAFSFTSITGLFLAACLSLVPILMKHRLREKFD